MSSYIFQHWINKAKTTFGVNNKGESRFALDTPSFAKHWQPTVTPATIQPERKKRLLEWHKHQVKCLKIKTATIAECLERETLTIVCLAKDYQAPTSEKRVFTLTSHDDNPPRGFWICDGAPRLIDGHCMAIMPKPDDIIWRFPIIQGSKVTVDITDINAPCIKKEYTAKSKLEPTWELCEKSWAQASKLFETIWLHQDLAFDIPAVIMKATLAKVEYEAYFYKQKVILHSKATGEIIMEIDAPDMHKDVCVAFNMKTLFRSKATRIAQHSPYSERHTSIKPCRIEHADGTHGIIMPIKWAADMLEKFNLTQGE